MEWSYSGMMEAGSHEYGLKLIRGKIKQGSLRKEWRRQGFKNTEWCCSGEGGSRVPCNWNGVLCREEEKQGFLRMEHELLCGSWRQGFLRMEHELLCGSWRQGFLRMEHELLCGSWRQGFRRMEHELLCGSWRQGFLKTCEKLIRNIPGPKFERTTFQDIRNISFEEEKKHLICSGKHELSHGPRNRIEEN